MRSSLHSKTSLMGPFERPTVFAWEEFMVGGTEYRAMAAEHHRLAGMCRAPESRERHLRLEQELLALAYNEECLPGLGTPQQSSEPRPVQIATAPR
jgi:hypothetical protein